MSGAAAGVASSLGTSPPSVVESLTPPAVAVKEKALKVTIPPAELKEKGRGQRGATRDARRGGEWEARQGGGAER